MVEVQFATKIGEIIKALGWNQQKPAEVSGLTYTSRGHELRFFEELEPQG